MNPFTFIAFFRDVLNAYNKMCEPVLHAFDIPQVSFDILRRTVRSRCAPGPRV